MSNRKKQYRIAVIPGDGIGKEVVPEGMRVLEAAAKKHGVSLHFDHFDFASWDYYEKHGEMMPEDWKDQIGKHDAIFFGAVGWPAKIPDHISLWGSLIKFRREFDQYVNLRPVRLMPGVPSPLANRKPGDIDFWVVRENTEGEYSSRRRPHVPGHRPRIRHPADGDDPHRRRSHSEIRVRSGAIAAEAAPDLGDQIQRNFDHHAVLGRARRGDGEGLSRGQMGQIPYRYSHRAFRASSRLVRRRGRIEPVRRHFVRSRTGLHRHHRHRALRQYQSARGYSRRCSSRCTAPRRI